MRVALRFNNVNNWSKFSLHLRCAGLGWKIENGTIFSTLRIFHTPHFLHSTFSTLRIFYTPHFPHSAFSTLRTPHSALRTPHSALRTPHSALFIFHRTVRKLLKQEEELISANWRRKQQQR